MGKRKNIYLEEKHIEWIDEEALNFSKWVRQKIEEEMKTGE